MCVVTSYLVGNGEERTPDKNGGKISRLYPVINGRGTELYQWTAQNGLHKKPKQTEKKNPNKSKPKPKL